MKALLVLLILSLPTAFIFGQGKFKGVIYDENNEPLIGANIYLKKIDQGSMTDNAGNFIIDNLQIGQYEIKVSYIGYETQTTEVEIRNNETSTLKTKLKTGGIQLSDVVVTCNQGRSINTLSQIDIKLRPVNTAQDVLRMVPGLFIAQHAGGGKAEQIFLRGFDIDHGTDISIAVDGLPVNMVSHAHGQGYADLHFLIPELINCVDFDKGPYFADKGDFNTAGYVDFQTKNKLEHNFVKAEGGSFGAARAVAGLNIPFKNSSSSAYIASEFYRSDGFFENNQKFKRFNLQSKFNTQIGNSTRLTFGLTAFSSQWNASGQIPDRAVENELITRYGSIDPTEWGSTGRFNAYVKAMHELHGNATLENQVYVTRYDFSLFSNFTFFLHDPVNGDQIHQRDGRWIYGYKSHYAKASTLFGKILKTEIGAGLRYDVIDDILLSHTVRRAFINYVKRGDIREANLNAYWIETLSLSNNLTLNTALRFDYLNFSYHDRLNASKPDAVGKSIVSPKLSMNYQASQYVNLFVRMGSGFHSNDARVVVSQSGKEILPKAYGMDVGADIKITPRLLVHTALWRLDLNQEFIYVGDEGVIEPSGKSKREGVDLSVRYQLYNFIFADLDMNVTKPRAKGVPESESYIPLAPTFTSIGGISFRKNKGFNGSLRYRYLANRAANEDYTIIAKGYLLADAMINFTQPGFDIGLSVENIFNTKWKEAQFDTESRLKNETASVSEIHFTPGTPFSLKLRFVKYF